MKTVALTLLTTMVLLMITSCAEDGTMTTGGKGAIGGGAAGAVVGQALGRNRYATVMVGAMGSILGYLIGEEMDKTDTEKLNNALESGQAGKPIAWKNPDTGDEYKIIPFEFVTDEATQQKCRNAKLVANLEGKEQITDTKACRSNDGQWALDTVK
jgi:surface antigen